MISPDTVAATLLALAMLLPLAWLGGALAERAGQTPVLGELLAGLVFAAFASLDARAETPVALLAEVGVVVLLFEIGLESDLGELRRVGPVAALVATTGVVLPLALGALAARIFLPDAPLLSWIFIGATLSATSVGISARILRDLGRTGTPEARLILGAAVIDDVLGLLLLSFLVGTARGGGTASESLLVAAKAVGFLALAVFALPPLLRRLPGAALLGTALCFGLGAAAYAAGLAPIVGAFVAGLALSGRGGGTQLAERPPWDETSSDPIPLRVAIRGLTALLVPLFFVEMGRRVDLRAAVAGATPLLLLALVAAAIAGKLLAGLAARGADRLTVGMGMIPRGEVGLVFAGLGRTLGLVDAAVTSTLVLVVLVTDLAGSLLLRRRLKG